MSDEPLNMSTFEVMMERMMPNLAKSDDVKELTVQINRRIDNVDAAVTEVKASVNIMGSKINSMEEDFNAFKHNIVEEMKELREVGPPPQLRSTTSAASSSG